MPIMSSFPTPLAATKLVPPPSPLAICLAALLALAVAMGVGRFAFTPLLPLMVRDGLLPGQAGAWLAASNYLGYLLGAWVAKRVPLRPVVLMVGSLLGITLLTAAMGWTHSLAAWVLWRLGAGVLSAWALVATSSWALSLLAQAGRPRLAGVVYAGVGLGILSAGMFCLLAAVPGVTAPQLWLELSVWTALAMAVPLVLTRRQLVATAAPGSPSPSPATPAADTQPVTAKPRHLPGHTGLVVCYGLFAFGYILPATFLPSLARQLVDDPQVFGWAWPLFGLAAGLSTLLVAWGLGHANRLRVWAVCHGLMAVGALLPSLWLSLTSVAVAATLVGGTFMVITMVGMQEAQARAPTQPTAMLGRMVTAFAMGQLAGPLVSALLGHVAPGDAAALNLALQLAALGLLPSAVWLWRLSRQPLAAPTPQPTMSPPTGA